MLKNMVDIVKVHSPLGNSEHGCRKIPSCMVQGKESATEENVPLRQGQLYWHDRDELTGVAWDALLTEIKGDPDTMYGIFCMWTYGRSLLNGGPCYEH